jgi:molecular chaperone DnaK
MVKNAEKMKNEDSKRKEMVEIKNEAESLIYNTEKQLRENDAKLPQDIKDRIKSDIASVNEAISSANHEKLKESNEKLRNSAMEMGRAIYQGQAQSGQQGTEQPNQQQSQDGHSHSGENKEEKKP